MLLHEFMSGQRDEILTACDHELQNDHCSEETADYVREFYDEVVRAMRRYSGVPESYSPLPGRSDTAARLGVERQRAGFPIERVPAIFGAISRAVSKTAGHYELSISSEESALLHECLDAGIATSIENYWKRDRSEATERATQVYSHLAHEMRNALGNVNMAWKLLRSGKLDVRGRTGGVIDRNLMRMGGLIAECLSRARMDAGHSVELTPVHVPTVLRDLEASALPDRDIRIVLETDDALFVSADESLLSSAIGNLLHNAIKFSPAASTVRLSAHAHDEQVRIEVEDECGGIGDTNLHDLCKPFVKHRTGSQKGDGLGLAIAKSAVEAMNGQLDATDRPGEGCTFTICFPILKPS